MPLLDVTSVLLDPLFAIRFDVIRVSMSVGANGVAVETEERVPNQVGVFVPDGDNGLRRGADATMALRRGTLICRYKLRQVGAAWQADKVVMPDGIEYTVQEIMPFQRYGKGFTEALVTSMNASDPSDE